MAKASHLIIEVYTSTLKLKNKIWMSRLNDMQDVDTDKDCWVLNLEGKNKRNKYFAKRIRLCP